MPAISKIRLCNVIYENGGKRYNDQLFQFDGQNSALLLENGGGKTVFIQTVLQAIIPHINMSDRKIKDTLHLEAGPAHIGIEWILNEQPRRYALTAVSLYQESGTLNSLKYTYEYSATDGHGIEELPFKHEVGHGKHRPASRGEIAEYYQRMAKTNPYAKVFNSISDYGRHLEESFKIIPSEWRKVAVINSGEGNVDEYFNRCKTTQQLLNNLLIPVVEEAIEGESSVQFAKTFEKQREHFKKNRILHDKIEQSQGAKVEIDNYINTYKVFNQVQKAYNKVKVQANSHMIYIKEAINGLESSKEVIEKRRRDLEMEKVLKSRQNISYKLLGLEKKIENEDSNLDAIEKRMNAFRQQRDQLAHRRQNIQLSKVEKNIKVLKEDLNRLEIELSIEDKELPIGDLKIQLEENSSNIKGCLSYELELVNIEKDRIEAKINELRTQISNSTQKLELAQVEERQVKDSIIKYEANIEMKREMMDSIYDELFDDRMGADVAEELIVWTEEVNTYEGNLSKVNTRQNENNDALISMSQAIGEKENELEEILKKLHESNDEIRSIEERSHQILEKMKAEGFSISSKDVIYTKEDTIKNVLKERIEHSKAKKEALVHEELLVMSRLLLKDIIHPSILKIFDRLKEKMSYIVTGLDYLDQLSTSMAVTKQSLLSKFPYFPMTLITNRYEKAAVVLAAEQLSEELSVPLFIYTIEEITKICQDTNVEFTVEEVVIPKLWENGLEKEYLSEYNSNLVEELEEIRSNRTHYEKIWIEVSSLQEEVNRFFDEYSYERYSQNVARSKEYDDLMRQIEVKLDEDRSEKSKLQTINTNLSEDQDGFLQLIDKVKQKIEKAKLHEAYYEEYLKIREVEEGTRSKLSDLIYKRKDLQFEINQTNLEIIELNNHGKEFDYEVRKIVESELYQEVYEAKPICNNSDLNTLKKQRESLLLRIQGISATRESLSIRIKEQETLLGHYLDQKNRLLKEAEYQLETIDVFYEHEEDDLFDKIVELKNEIKAIEQEAKKTEKVRWSLDTERNLLINDLTLKGMERYLFDCEVEHIPTRIKMLEGTIRDIEKHIRIDADKLSKKVNIYQEAQTALMVKDGAYNFIAENGQGLTTKEVELLEDDIPMALHQLFKKLSDTKALLDVKRRDVTDSKKTVLDYCQQHVDDYRLKDAIEKGLMEKEDYEELLIYQERLTDIIHKTIQLATDDKRESDQELVTFLSHLYTYVITVIEELDALQKKTIIEGDEINKQIFVFEIPDINPDSARDSLRIYIDQMIEMFENESSEDEDSIRELIEDRFNVKNLIPVVLEGVAIKVKCRKVTNDLKINKAPMSWEFSNKWSGGEKWSKNMTLFLGILNYLAEKKQHLSTHQKNNRTVILDNPFGKASSKHVLDPVFYIADKLGFQIVALTAHAEGQFIRDYFPVVYSLRLRETNHQEKKLVTTERMLNYTYLKEKAPASISRLQEAHQMDIFM